MNLRGRSRHRFALAFGAFALVGSTLACGSDQGSGPASSGAAAAQTSTTAPAPEWMAHDAPAGCRCADGSEFTYFSRSDDPERVLLYFQGGGACFSAETCRFDSGTYKATTGPADNPDGAEGIFDLDDPRNPFAGWSMIFVPYCSGDVHLGDATTEYAPGLTIEHNGYRNATAGLDHLVEHFPDATEVFVTGSSAGGVPAPLFGGLVADALPDADVTVLADASGGYPSNVLINGAIGGLWDVYANLPDWPVVEGRRPEEIGIPDLFWLAGTHAPEVRMARFDNAHDEVQRTFSALAGAGGGGLPAALDRNEQLIEAAGVDLSVYVAPGTEHTILTRPELYDLTVGDTPFVDWLTTLADGDAPGDVRCTDCGDPLATG